MARIAELGQLSVQTVAGWPGFVGKGQVPVRARQCLDQLGDRLRLTGNTPIKPHFAAASTFSDCNSYRHLAYIQAYACCIPIHGSCPMSELVATLTLDADMLRGEPPDIGSDTASQLSTLIRSR